MYWTRALVLVVLAATAVLHAASYSFAISDDAFISLRYAANLANGHGLVFNPGESPVEGFSNPLFTWIVACLLWFGADPVLAVRGIGVVSSVAIVLSLPVCARIFQSSDLEEGAKADATTLMASAFFAASAFPAFWAVGGLETIFYALVVLLATALTSMELRRETVRWSPVLFAAVAATRPEGAFLGAFAFLAVCFSGAPRGTIRAWSLGFGLPVAVLLAARLAYYGAFTPNTASVKVAFGIPAVISGLTYLWQFTVAGAFWLVVPAIFACAALLRRARTSESTRSAVLPLIAVVAGQVIFILLVGRDGFPGYRFAMPVYPLLCILAALGLCLGLRSVWERWRFVVTSASVLLICAGIYSAQRNGLYEHPRRWWLAHDRPWSTYALQQDLSGTWLAGHEEIAEYLKRHAEPDDGLAVTEAGVIPFISNLPTLDLLGLNDRTIADLRKGSRYGPPPGRAASPEDGVTPWTIAAAERLFSINPKWVVVDGRFDGEHRFVPRLNVTKDLVRHRDWKQYREVMRAQVFDGEPLGFDHDRINVLFVRSELSDSRDAMETSN